eukprot:jgi/Botrbrau1/23162/Bobra.0041s0013.1
MHVDRDYIIETTNADFNYPILRTSGALLGHCSADKLASTLNDPPATRTINNLPAPQNQQVGPLKGAHVGIPKADGHQITHATSTSSLGHPTCLGPQRIVKAKISTGMFSSGGHIFLLQGCWLGVAQQMFAQRWANLAPAWLCVADYRYCSSRKCQIPIVMGYRAFILGHHICKQVCLHI